MADYLGQCPPPTTQYSQQTEEHIQWQTPVTVKLIRQAEEVLCPQGHSAFQRRAEGEGGRWTSLHESTSVCPPLLISSQPHAQTLPPTYSALSLCSLHFPNTHTHTQAQDHYLALPILTSTRTLYIFLHSPHQLH